MTHYPTIPKLRTFVAIASCMSFRKAAEQLHLTQPALSAHIRDLERDLGISLFLRTTRSVELTAEGERLLIRVRRAIEELDTGLEEVRQHTELQRGRVAVACMPSFANRWLPRVIAIFVKRYPQIEIKVYDENATPVVRRVLCGDADFGLCSLPESNRELTFEPIIEDRFVAVFRNRNGADKLRSIRLANLMKFPILTLSRGANIRDIIDNALLREGISFQPAFESFDRYTVFGMVEAGLGVALIPEMMVPPLGRSSPFQIVPVIKPSIIREFGIIKRQRQPLSPAADAFLVAIRDRISLATPAYGKKPSR